MPFPTLFDKLRESAQRRTQSTGIALGIRDYQVNGEHEKVQGSREDFFRNLIEYRLSKGRLPVSDRYTGLVTLIDAMLSETRYQRHMVRFMRDVLSRISHLIFFIKTK